MTFGAHDEVSVWVDGKLSGLLRTDIGEGEKLASLLRVKAMLAGQEPHWLTKDFNVLYRAADGAAVQACLDGYLTAHMRGLLLQLERLKPAFTDTEEVRAWMRGERE